MFFLKDPLNKIIFGWSAKSGCSHVKKIYYYLATNSIYGEIHTMRDCNNIGSIDKNYKIFIFIRNPYERIISGFLDKYKKNGIFYNRWNKKIPLTFNNFVDELFTNNYKMIDKHHFTPQLSESWNDNLINNNNLKVYDINNIDYEYIGNLYNKKIPEILLNFRGGHENIKELFDYGQNIKIYDLLQEEYDDKKPITKNFYNEDIKNKIYTFYKKDFEYFNSIGFCYDIVK